MVKLTKEDENKLGQILKELNETRKIIKERIYVNPSNAPKGAKLQRGPKGGTYYESGGGQSVSSKVKPSQAGKISPQGQKVADWAEKKYGKDALYMLQETGEGREVYGDNLTNEAISHLKQKYPWRGKFPEPTKEELTRERVGGIEALTGRRRRW